MGGDSYLSNAISLNCTVEAQGTHEQFDISWVYSGPGRNIAQDSTAFSQSLWFNSLTASHAGVYVCNASLIPTTGSEQINITLQCKTMIPVSILALRKPMIAIIFSVHEPECLCEH